MEAKPDETALDDAIERARDKANRILEPLVRTVVLGGAFVGGCVAAWNEIKKVSDEATKPAKRGKQR